MQNRLYSLDDLCLLHNPPVSATTMRERIRRHQPGQQLDPKVILEPLKIKRKSSSNYTPEPISFPEPTKQIIAEEIVVVPKEFHLDGYFLLECFKAGAITAPEFRAKIGF